MEKWTPLRKHPTIKLWCSFLFIVHLVFGDMWSKWASGFEMIQLFLLSIIDIPLWPVVAYLWQPQVFTCHQPAESHSGQAEQKHKLHIIYPSLIYLSFGSEPKLTALRVTSDVHICEWSHFVHALRHLFCTIKVFPYIVYKTASVLLSWILQVLAIWSNTQNWLIG